MASGSDHRRYAGEKSAENYRFPHVCVDCRKSFKLPRRATARTCPDCGQRLQLLSRKFSAPKRSDERQWAKVAFLVEHGFLFQSVFEQRQGNGQVTVKYPDTLKEAQAFAKTYSSQAIKELE